MTSLLGRRSPARVLLLAAHPDDETVGAAGLLQRLIGRGARVLLAHVTDGAPADMRDARRCGFATRSGYAAARRAELTRAMACLSAPPQLVSLGFEDQRTCCDLQRVVGAVTALMGVWNPAVVLTHPYEGGHPDHDSTAFAARTGLGRLRAGGLPVPDLYEFTSYHLWNGRMRTGTFLRGEDSEIEDLAPTDPEIVVKRRMLGAFASQSDTLRVFEPDRPERFRPAPQYDFGAAPHDGLLHYELYAWGTDGAAWRRRAAAIRPGAAHENLCG